MGSSAEVENLLMLANDLGYIEDDFHKLQGKIIEIRKMLNVYMQRIKSDIEK